MLRNAFVGALAFGALAALAGYVWVTYEFPFAVALPAAAGWFAVARGPFGPRSAAWAALVGGISFTLAFIAAMFVAIVDGSSLPLPAWAGVVLAAAVAGALTGWVLSRGRGAWSMAGFSAAGMVLAMLASAALRQIAPSGVDAPGATQSAYFAFQQGVVGAVIGAALGVGVAWLALPRPAVGPDPR